MYALATLDPDSLHRARARTTLLTAAIVAAMVAVSFLCADFVLGDSAVPVTATIAISLFIVTARPPIWLVMRAVRAVPLTPYDAPGLYRALGTVARRAGLPVPPPLYRLPVAGINAFAVGAGGRAAIAVSDGALSALPQSELIAVLAHEVAHLAAGDTRLMAVGAILIRVTQAMASIGLALVAALLLFTGDAADVPVDGVLALGLATPAAALLYLALSRSREFAADLTAARLTGDAVALARALERIDRWAGRRGGRSSGLLRTHPATADRVANLLGTVRLVPTAPGWLPRIISRW